MRRLTILLTIASVFIAASAVALAQETYTGADYSLELPSERWRVVQEPDSLHEHAEFIYGDRMDGYLRVRKEVVEAGTTPSNLLQRDQDQKRHFQPGDTEGK